MENNFREISKFRKHYIYSSFVGFSECSACSGNNFSIVASLLN